jgi:hypothetical protein
MLCLNDVGFLLHEGVAVLCEPAAGRQEQTTVLWRLFDQALNRL